MVKYIGVLACLLWVVGSGSSQVAMSLTPAIANPGETISVPIAISALNAQVSGIQWAIQYDSRIFSSASVAVGPVAAQAGKMLRCNTIAAGRMTCLVLGFNSQVLTSGVVATLALTANASANGGNTAVMTIDSVGTTPLGTAVPVVPASTNISIRAGSADLTSLACSATSIPAGGSSTCTLNLSGAAPAGGMIVSLGSTTMGNGSLNVPRTVVIPAGARSATFTVGVSAITGLANVVLTATVNAVSRSWTLQLVGANVAITVSPAGISLRGGESAQFQAAVTGTKSTAVTWSLSPNIGSLSSTGRYTAPAQIAATTQVMITATSVEDSSKRSSAILTLTADIRLSVAPAAVTLSPGQNVAFRASLQGTQNTAVTWSLSTSSGSPVGSGRSDTGTISASGVYTAPVQISPQTQVRVLAISLADRTKTAAAVITLMPRASIAVTPFTATVAPGQSAQFIAAVAGLSNSSVKWSIQPAWVGTISASGLYTAPRSLGGASMIWVTATSVADPSKQARAVILISAAAAVRQPYSMFSTAAVPEVLDEDDSEAVELGMKFYADTDGYVTGVKFYKGQLRNAGPHIVNLWTASGQKVATATVDSGTSTGWQQGKFPKPVAIRANTIYVVSYFAPNGHYSVTENYFGPVKHNAPLHVPAGEAGVYGYDSQSVFPTESYRGSNYWIDVMFTK